MNIEDLSIEDLVKMRDQLVEVLAGKVQARQRELSSEAERLAGLITQKAKPKAFKPSPAKPKYQKGDLSWSGRGSQPGWVKTHLALGGTMEELASPH